MRKPWRLRWLAVLPLVLLLAAAGYYLYVRYVLMNFHTVVEGKVYRSAQPSPEQLEAWIHQYDLKTVLNLRGESFTLFSEEEAAARRAGAAFVTIAMSSDELPASPTLMRLAKELETATKPMLIHCQQGADRSGLASVMARMAVGGKPYDRAKEQMGLKFLHIDPSSEHVGAVLTEYEDYCRDRKVDTGGWAEFRDWIFHVYRPSYHYVEYEVPQELTARPGEELQVAVRCINRSTLPVPAGNPERKIALLVSLEEPHDAPPAKWLPPPVPLPLKDIAPEGAVTVDVHLTAPDKAGEFVLLFDLEDDEGLPFRHEGAEPGVLRLKVTPAP